MSETAKTLEQRILEPILAAGYGELIEFATTLADRINNATSYDAKPTGDVVASVLFAWAQDSTQTNANG